MTTINVRTEGKAVVLEIADDERVRCKLKLTPERAERLAEQLLTEARPKDIRTMLERVAKRSARDATDDMLGDLFGKRGGR